MIEAVVGRPRPLAERLRRVVVPAYQALGVDIEDLVSAVRLHRLRKAHRQAPPALAVLLPGLQLAELVALAEQDEGRRYVGPDRIGAEVEDVQAIPPEPVAQIAERSAGVAPGPRRGTALVLDANLAVGLENVSRSRRGVRLEGHRLANRGHASVHRSDGMALEIGGERESPGREADRHLAGPLPCREAAVSVDRPLCQLAPVADRRRALRIRRAHRPSLTSAGAVSYTHLRAHE